MIFLPNPNMPIEGTLNKDELIGLTEYCHNNNTILAVDEVYYPFGGPEMEEYGVFDDLDENGFLILKLKNGSKTIHHGAVSLS